MDHFVAGIYVASACFSAVIFSMTVRALAKAEAEKVLFDALVYFNSGCDDSATDTRPTGRDREH